MLVNRRRSSRSRIATHAAPIWQSLLDWLPKEKGARRKTSPGSLRTRLGVEALEERTVLTTNIDFNVGTGVLTLNVDAAETVNLDVASIADFNITSDAGTSVSASAALLGFTPEGANIVSDGSLATVTRIDIVGSAGVQTVNFNGGVFAATTVVDGAQDIENVNFTAATTFSKLLGGAPTADVNVTASTSLTQSAGAAITTTDGGNISLTALNGDITANAAISSTGGNGAITVSAAGNISVNGPVGVAGSGDITIDADTDSDGAGFFANTALGTLATAGGDVTITAQDVDLLATVNAGAGDVNLQTRDGGSINLGADGVTVNDFGVTNVEVNLLTAATVRIGDAAAGSVTVSAPITLLPINVPTLSLTTGAGISANAGGAISVANLAITASGAVTLTQANDVDNLAVNVAGSGNAFAFVDADGLSVGAVDGVTGITTVDGNVSVTDTTGVLTVASAIASANGDVALSADDMAISAAVNAGATGIVTLQQAGTVLRNIDLGTNAALSLGLTAAEIDLVTGALLRVGRLDNAGDISVSAAINAAGTNTLSLLAGGGITQTAAITETNLAIQAAGSVALAAANDVDNLAVNVSGAGNSLTFADTDALNLGTVDGIVGVSTTAASGAFVDLEAAGALTQSAGASITSNGLALTGAGTAAFNLATNDVATIAATGTGSISYRDASALAVGTVNGTVGITTTDDDVSLQAGGALSVDQTIALGLGNLTLNAAAAATQTASITAGGLELLGVGPFTLNLATNDVATLAANSTGAVNVRDANGLIVGTVNATAGLTANGAVALTADTGALTVNTAVNTSGADLTLSADDMAFNALVNAGAAITTLQQASATLRNIDLGSNTAGSLGLTDAELDVITTGTLRIGRLDNAGNITLTGNISPASATTLDLRTGGSIVDATVAESADLTVSNLVLSAAAGIGTADEIDTAVDTLAAVNTATGSINVSDNGSLTVGSVAGVNGVSNTAAGGQVNVTAQNALTLANNVTAAGNVGLTAGASAAAADNLSLNPGVTVQSTAGNVTLTAGDLVNVPLTTSVLASGTLGLNGGSGEVDGGGGVNVQGALAGATATISGGGGADIFNLNPSAAPAAISVLGQAGADTLNISPSAATAFNVDAGDVLNGTGDILNLDFTGTTGTNFVAGLPGAGAFNFTNRQQVNFAGVESLNNVSVVENTAVLVPDPLNLGQNTLVVTGTAANDRIIVDLVNHNTQIRVRIIKAGPDTTLLFAAASVNKIVVSGLAGNDSISISSKITVATELSGGDGNDRLTGGSGNDILRGGAGNDLLYGGKGNDVLLGEEGNDKVYGQTGLDILIGGLGTDIVKDTSGENVLIGGTTSLDATDAALLSLMQIWANTLQTFQLRTDAVRLLLHPDPLATVLDDGVVDRLISGSNNDFFIDFALADRTNVRAGHDRLN